MIRSAIFLLTICTAAFAQAPTQEFWKADSENFTVVATSETAARAIATKAEEVRRDFAKNWFGKPFPRWSAQCPIKVNLTQSGGGGRTRFTFDRGQVSGWEMEVEGSEEAVLESVIPHEVTHTLLATYFRRALPRWADEGFSSHVESQIERVKLYKSLLTALRSDRGIAFSAMFAMDEYPKDILPLYSQGYTLTSMLIEQKGEKHFLDFLGGGMQSRDWPKAVKDFYGYEGLGALQESWLERVQAGRF